MGESSLLLKKTYRKLISSIENLPKDLDLAKTYVFELQAIAHKSPLYRDIKWTPEQQSEFDEYWLTNYGKKIPNSWHKLYQAASGVFRVDYIPEMLYTTKVEPMMNDRAYARVLEDKSLVQTFAKDCGCIVPETVCVCTAGHYYDDKRNPITKAELVSRIHELSEVVGKPSVGGSSGKGVHFIQDCSSLNDCELEALLYELGRDYIFQHVIKPHTAFSACNSTSINTVRIITYLTENGFHHAPIAFRIGRAHKRVDNIHAGGIVVGVCDDGSLLSTAYELGYGDSNIQYQKHPDSGVVFENYKIPKVPEIIQAAYSVHGRLPHTGIVSWDFTVDEDENVVLIEANIRGQGVWFPQMIHGKGLFGDQTPEILQMVREKA